MRFSKILCILSMCLAVFSISHAAQVTLTGMKKETDKVNDEIKRIIDKEYEEDDRRIQKKLAAGEAHRKSIDSPLNGAFCSKIPNELYSYCTTGNCDAIPDSNDKYKVFHTVCMRQYSAFNIPHRYRHLLRTNQVTSDIGPKNSYAYREAEACVQSGRTKEWVMFDMIGIAMECR